MIMLLGETAAAREISRCLDMRELEYIRTQTWTRKTCLMVPSVILDASPPSSSAKFASLYQWCEQRTIPYLRLERPETIIPASSFIHPVFSWEEALLKLEKRVGVLHKANGRIVTVL